MSDSPIEVATSSQAPSANSIRSLVAHIAESPPFQRSARMQAFLRYIVEETLEGRGRQIKEYGIGIEVFGKPSDFDPGTSAVVRVEAGRLRRLLAQYQNEYGKADALRILIPKGNYMPVFEPIDHVCPPDASSQKSDAAEHDSGVRLPPVAERRLVTVLSCALDGSDSSKSLADIDSLEAFDLFYNLCADIAQNHGAGIDGGASDRLIAYFGWPDAIEDAAGRALTAALEMIAAVGGARLSASQGIRISVATSDVAVRFDAGPQSSLPRVVGPAPAMAMKILRYASFNGILVAEATRQLAGASFEFIPVGGIDEVDAGIAPLWRLLRAKPDATRFQAATCGVTGDLVGRREELALLMNRWTLTKEGEGQAVLMIGEAGIGKSRLAEAMLATINSAASILRMQCSPHHGNSALYPWIDAIRTETGLDADSAPDDPRLSHFLENFGLDEPQNRDVLGSLLSLTPVRLTGQSSASRHKDLTLRLIERLLAARVSCGPVLLLVEDLHWADPTTLELLQDILGKIQDMHLLLLMTSRPDAIIPALRQTVITSIRLPRLPKADCYELIDRLTAVAPIPEDARSSILLKAEGVPLFIEELTKLVLSGGSGTGQTMPLPDRLSDLLTGQFSRLGSSHGIAQIASVIGRQFNVNMLAQCAGVPVAHIVDGLDQLLAAGMVIRHSADRSDIYIFRHALFREAAYNSLLLPARRVLHGKIADIILHSFTEIVLEQPEIVAHHFDEAGRFDEALQFWLKAGQKSMQAYALDEAVSAFRRAFNIVSQLPESPSRCERELDTLIQLGLAVRHAKGYSDSDLLDIYARARFLAADLKISGALASATYGLWTHCAGQGDWPKAVALAAEFEGLVPSISDNGQHHIEAARLLGASAAFRGEFNIARDHFESAIAAYDGQVHGPVFGYDPAAVSAAYLAWTLWHLGEVDGAGECAQLALELADHHRHPSTIAVVHAWLIFHALCERNPDRVRTLNKQLQYESTERECRYWEPFGSAAAAWAAFQSQPQERHLATLLEGTSAFNERYLTSCLLLLGAEMSGMLGNPGQGLTLVQEAFDFIEEHEERIWEAEAYRIRAELLLLLSKSCAGEAFASAQMAVQVASRQKAISLSKRATVTLAKMIDVEGDEMP